MVAKVSCCPPHILGEILSEIVPSTLFLRTKYIREKVCIPPIFQKVACHYCHSLKTALKREELE